MEGWEWLVTFVFVILLVVVGYMLWVDRNRRG